jgi:hypothetical protein
MDPSTTHPILPGKLGPRIVRSWFDTVLNPMLQTLNFEHTLLTERNWTWRAYSEKLESMGLNKTAVSEDNLEQVLQFYPELGGLRDIHEEKVARLEEACRALHRVIASHPSMREALDRVKQDDSPTPQGSPLNSVLDNRNETDGRHLEYLAEYAVNGVRKLPDYYTYSQVWNKYSSLFLKPLEDDEVRRLKESTDTAGDELLRSVGKLISQIKDIRGRLSLEFDVPFVSSHEDFEQ